MQNVAQRRRPSPVALPRGARGPIFAAAGDSEIANLTRAFDVHNGETVRSIKALQGTIATFENEFGELNSKIAAMQVMGTGNQNPASNRQALNAFGEFVRSGKTDAMAAFRPQAAGSVDNDPSGGYLGPGREQSLYLTMSLARWCSSNRHGIRGARC